jgi:Flp pilus assembly protein TadD
MFRSKGSALLAAAALALGAIVWARYGRQPHAAFDRRADQNILLVTIDTLRADAMSSYGGPARTPNLDRLAAGGTRFDFAHAHAVLTRPSHTSILTGTYPYEHGVRDHSGYRLKPGTGTIASLLKQHGFATGAFVGGIPLERRFGLDGGFDVYERAFHASAIEPGMTTQLGSYLAEAGRPTDAISLLEPLASRTPADPDALNALGIAYARAGQADKSATVFHRVLDENPSNVQALENVGTLEMQRGNLPGAQRALEQAVAIDPRSARAHNGLAVVAMRSGRRDEAFTQWKRAAELAPNDFDALYNLATELDAAGRHEEARPFLDRFVREAPPAQYGPDIARVRKLLSTR